MEATVVDGNGTETGHIIVTTIGGRNGQPKQVYVLLNFLPSVKCVYAISLTVFTMDGCKQSMFQLHILFVQMFPTFIPAVI